ncbi:MAG: hypothetical protein K2W82_03035 [Candidatus Obscuribacterales bacterium]|nr:hypothetical protein [Candidatus Obscuribacterales bacterium]
MSAQEILCFIAVITAIIVGLPCLLLRPLFIALADRIAGKDGSRKQLKELNSRIELLEKEITALKVQMISIESVQEFSNKLVEEVKSSSVT